MSSPKNKRAIVVLVSILLLASITSVEAGSVENTFEAFSSGGWTFNLNSGNKISGTVEITHPVIFSIADPEGYIIQDFNKIEQTTSFEFTASKTGKYSFKFQAGVYDTKIKLTTDIQSGLPKGNILGSDSQITPEWLPLVVFLVAGSFVLVALIFGFEHLLKRSRKKEGLF